MIVRILGEGQYELDDGMTADLDRLDAELNTALEGGDDAGFDRVLTELAERIRSSGRPLEPDRIVPSDLTVPAAGSTIEEVQKLLTSEDLGEA